MRGRTLAPTGARRFDGGMTRILLLLTLAAAVAVPAAAAMDAVPVTVVTAPEVGPIATTKAKLALYTWSKERSGMVECTGSCATTWRPLTVPAHTMVAKHVKGLMGTLGTTRRPDGRTQVTLDGHPLYTHRGDTPTKFLTAGMEGWHVVRA
jgi:predicted lipoprotein with Yx(FWY)xxD motif